METKTNQPPAYDINALYQELFGRAPDEAGLEYWQAQAPAISAEGGQNKLREAMIGGAMTPDANYYNSRNISDTDWLSYMGRAAQQTAGINNMPGVFSNYGGLATGTPDQNYASMYRSPEQLQAALEQMAALYGPAGGMGGIGGFGNGRMDGVLPAKS